MATDKIGEIPGATAWESFQIALIVWVVCAVCTVVPARFEPVKHVQRIDPPKVVKVHERVIPAALRFTAGLPWSCETIRNAVGSLTRRELEQLARAYRLTTEQRAEAMKCLRREVRT